MITRIAPSPIGKFHVGTLRTALLNYVMEMIDLFNEGNISNRNCNIDQNKLIFLEKKWKQILK